MAKHPVVRGHPIHAALSDAPAALAPVAAMGTLWSKIHSTPGNELFACRTTRIAAAGAGAAVLAGWWDWLKMPRDHPAWKPATLHGALNTAAAAALVTGAVRGRWRLRATMLATALVAAGAWLGGELVFRHGWRVRPAEEYEIVAGRLSREGREELLAGARREVEDFERKETYLGE